GSTSQAANVMEALEAQTSLLLIDEDTSATNFMIRDGRMQKLIAPEKEPITPFSNKVKSLYEDYDVSTILIVGGSGDYFDVADQVLM
ncbi:P-loop domain-containing protein, partial [Staphylococcus epidermidis]